jgi:hypothetical protein
MDIALLVPGPFETISGGYIYDRRLVAGLRAKGHAVQVVVLAGRHPLPDAAATAAARAALDAVPAGTRIVVDGLGLPAFAPFAEELAARRAIGLIHHPTANEHGNPGPVREELRGLALQHLQPLRPEALCVLFGHGVRDAFAHRGAHLVTHHDAQLAEFLLVGFACVHDGPSRG